MPKGLNLKNFGRRKSSQSGLDFPEEEQPAAASSFRVIERPDKKRVTYGAPDRVVNRPFSSPLHALRGRSENDLGSALEASKISSRQSSVWPLTGARGSGGTVASGSSGYYDSSASARHSSTSTLSIDPDRTADDEEHSPAAARASTTSMSHTASAPADVPAPPSSFAERAARTFSFAKTARKESKDDVRPPVPPPHGLSGSSPGRDRAMTTSSYASTAVPPKAELTLGHDFGSDFGDNMFDSLQKQDGPLLSPVTANNFHRTDSEPMFPPRALSRGALSPSPKLQPRGDELESPYLYDESLSTGLLSSSSARSSPRIDSPPARVSIAQSLLGNTNPGYSRVPDRYTSPILERHSYESLVGQDTISANGNGKEPEYPNRQTQIDEDDRWIRKVSLRDPQGSSISPGPTHRLAPPNGNSQPPPASRINAQASAGASRARSPGSSTGDSRGGSDSIHTTPRASKGVMRPVGEDSLFDSSPAGSPSRAVRPSMNFNASADGAPRKITKAEFQALQKRSEGSPDGSDEEEHISDDEDDEDDIERAKKIATQRRQQQATMSVYRQQMKKVTGGGPTDLPGGAANRPSNDRGYSAPGLHFGGIGGTPPSESVRGQHSGDDDEDVPLGILQAHGFPSANRPPTVAENDMHQRASLAGSTVGAGQGNLPPFARRLPADPYFGAGLVNPSTRESLHGPAASVYGMPTGPSPGPMGHPAGLVGVIAGEERARAARRGSPNAAFGNGGNVANMPLPGNMAMGQRTMSMGNMASPSVYTPSGVLPMSMMPMMPMGMPMMSQGMDPASQQMQHFMQMQMQMMQNMMAMQQAQLNGQNPQDFGSSQRPMSMASQGSFSGPQHGRSMTMMNQPQGWNSSGPGQPRPNSVMPQFSGSYASSVGNLAVPGGQPGQGYTPSIAPSERSNVGRASRYRPVSQFDDSNGGRTQSMTSSHTLQAFTRQQSSQNVPGTPFNGTTVQTPKSTIRVVDKAKGGPKSAIGGRQVADEDEDDGWAEMKKKREDKKKSKWTLGRKGKNSAAEEQAALEELYQGIN